MIAWQINLGSDVSILSKARIKCARRVTARSNMRVSEVEHIFIL